MIEVFIPLKYANVIHHRLFIPSENQQTIVPNQMMLEPIGNQTAGSTETVLLSLSLEERGSQKGSNIRGVLVSSFEFLPLGEGVYAGKEGQMVNTSQRS